MLLQNEIGGTLSYSKEMFKFICLGGNQPPLLPPPHAFILTLWPLPPFITTSIIPPNYSEASAKYMYYYKRYCSKIPFHY